LRLARLAALYVFLPGFPEDSIRLGTRHDARSARQLLHVASNKIEFKYLNGNLMVPKIHRLTLTFDRSSRKADNVASFVSRNE
jgi:hypothetical protein